MDVDQTERRRRDDRFGQNLSVRGDHSQLGLERSQRLKEPVIYQPPWLKNGHAVLERQPLDGRFAHLLSSIAWPIGSRDDADQSVGGAEEGGKRRHRKFRSAKEHDAKPRGRYHLPARLSFLIRRTIRSRLMPRSRSMKSCPSRWSISC